MDNQIYFHYLLLAYLDMYYQRKIAKQLAYILLPNLEIHFLPIDKSVHIFSYSYHD
jgi:hypothetical protein